MIAATPALTALGHTLETSPSAFGWLRSSEDCLGQPARLRERLEEDGYLYIRGFFDRDLVMAARASMTDRLQEKGLLHPDHPALSAIIAPGQKSRMQPELAQKNPRLERVAYGPELLGFYEQLRGGPIRHFDHTWVRAVGPGPGTHPHCDIVYMGRGTPDLLTCWIPYGDVPLELGGLIVLENSHKKSDVLRPYLAKDVDSYCSNRPAEAALAAEGKSSWPGWLSNNPASLREKLGGRWLTADWRAGDFITFKMSLVHGSLDNQTDQIRLSTDTRYQLAAEKIDERWVGPNPAGHGKAGKLGRIC